MRLAKTAFVLGEGGESQVQKDVATEMERSNLRRGDQSRLWRRRLLLRQRIREPGWVFRIGDYLCGILRGTAFRLEALEPPETYMPKSVCPLVPNIPPGGVSMMRLL